MICCQFDLIVTVFEWQFYLGYLSQYKHCHKCTKVLKSVNVYLGKCPSVNTALIANENNQTLWN